MARRYEFNNTGDTDLEAFGGNGGIGQYWAAQVFTPSTTHKITSLKLKLIRDKELPVTGTITVSIRATSGGEPTGPDLTSGTTDGDTLPIAAEGIDAEWRTITLTPYKLSANTQYAIVFRALTASNNTAGWRVYFDEPYYSGGRAYASTDGGNTWVLTNCNFMFEEWGDPAYLGNPNIDQLIYQHAERMERFT